MLKKFWNWIKSLVIPTKPPVKPPAATDGGGGPGEENKH